MSLKISKDKFENYICAIAGIFSMNPYFVWPTFMNGIMAYSVYALYLISVYIMINRGIKLRRSNLIGSLLLCLIFAMIYLHSYTGIGIKTLLGGVSLYLYLICFCNLDTENQKQIFVAFTKVFVFSLIPGLIYYILEIFGISLSIGQIYSQNQLNYLDSVEYLSTGNTGFYKLYVGAVLRVNSNTRFSGIYDEAGLVGTVAALCLAGNQMDLKNNRWTRWLLLFVVISFSLASYILVAAYFIVSFVRRKQWKLISVVILMTFGLYILMTIETPNPLIQTLQSRFRIVNGMITIVDNRTTSNFNIGYSELLNGTLVEKMFGFGRGASVLNKYMNGSSSYKNYIYNYGFVGFGIMIFTIIYLYKRYLKKFWKSFWPQFTLFVLFTVSIYQRPNIYMPYYFILLFGGAAYLYKEQISSVEENKNASN